MKICPYCRNVMATGQTICDICGETVPDVEMMSKKAITLKPRKAPEQIASKPTINDTEEEKKYQRGKIIITSISAGIVVLGIVLALLLFF